MNYKEQLKTSAWLRKKYEIMNRDNFVCSSCMCDNYESQLEVHHIGYKNNSMAWEYQDYFLVTLCRNCHEKEHEEIGGGNSRAMHWLMKLTRVTKIFII